MSRDRAGEREEGAPRLHPSCFADPAVFLVTGFATGFLHPAPGTWGSLLALAVWWWLLAGLAWPVQLAVVAVTVAAGTWLSHVVCRRYGVHDDPGIVIDEVAGMWLTLVGAPATVLAAVCGLVLFRALDITKLGPVGWADRRVSGAVGVMLDDLIAGGLGLAVLQLAFRVLAWHASAGSP